MTTPVAVPTMTYDPAIGLREDASLKAHLQGLIVSDRDNNQRVVPVFFRVPETEARRNVFPYITIDPLSGPVRDPSREHRGTIFWDGSEGYRPVNEPEAGDFAKSDYPVPMIFRYQITTWTRYAQQDRQLLMQLTQGPLASRFGCLLIVDTRNGANDSDNSLRRIDIETGPIPTVVLDGEKKRIFRQVWTVVISSEMFMSDFVALPKITSVVFDPPPADTGLLALDG